MASSSSSSSLPLLSKFSKSSSGSSSSSPCSCSSSFSSSLATITSSPSPISPRPLPGLGTWSCGLVHQPGNRCAIGFIPRCSHTLRASSAPSIHAFDISSSEGYSNWLPFRSSSSGSSTHTPVALFLWAGLAIPHANASSLLIFVRIVCRPSRTL